MEPQILINEVCPNPESGSEWIELFLVNEETDEDFSLANFTIFDNARQIYKFNNEQFINQLLVIEVSGLNNDSDSVILKNAQGNILDSFIYDKSEKGLSWSKDKINNIFVLTTPSRNLDNPTITATPTPSPTYTPTPTVTLSTTVIPTATLALTQTPNKIPIATPQKKPNINIRKIFEKYDLNKIKLNSYEKEMQNRELRLVFLGKHQGQAEVINAIIGSFLIILSASFLIYAKIKNKHHQKLLLSLFFANALGWCNFFLI